jgi:hypothetical protein
MFCSISLGHSAILTSFYQLEKIKAISSIGWEQLSSYHLNTETESGLRNVVFNITAVLLAK